MYWFRVVFVVIIIELFDSIQNQVNDTADEPPTDSSLATTEESIEQCLHKSKIFATACKIGSNVTLNITWFGLRDAKRLITKIKGGDPNECCDFKNGNSTFVSDLGCIELNCLYEIFSGDSKAPYVILGLDLINVEEDCPATTEICLVDSTQDPIYSFQDCPILNNLSVTTMYHHELEFISLTISWDKIEGNETANRIRIIASEYNNRCQFIKDVFDYPLSQNFIIKPPSDSLPLNGIEPDCIYEITVEHNNGICRIDYIVPECVENKCNCNKFKPRPKILSVEPESGDDYLVKWDPGIMSIYNKSYKIERMQFTYEGKRSDIIGRETEWFQPNLTHNSTRLSMKLFKGEEYTLSGRFFNNFTCIEQVMFDFTVSKGKNSRIAIFFVFTASVTIYYFK